ncbi:MAG TPA: penicillin-binding protein 1C, partial [Thermoanaerobaculia bacterium]
MMRRGGRGLARGRGFVLAAALVACLALWRYVEQLGPLDLTAAGSRSTVVLDRDGRLLRPFATPEGRWRLPVETGDVDPRY